MKLAQQLESKRGQPAKTWMLLPKANILPAAQVFEQAAAILQRMFGRR